MFFQWCYLLLPPNKNCPSSITCSVSDLASSEMDTSVHSFAFCICIQNKVGDTKLFSSVLFSVQNPHQSYSQFNVLLWANHAARISVTADQSLIKDDEVTMLVIDDLPWSVVKVTKPLGWLLHGPLEAVVAIDVDDAETTGVALSPLEVV